MICIIRYISKYQDNGARSDNCELHSCFIASERKRIGVKMTAHRIHASLLRQLNERRILNTVRLLQPISRASLGREIRLATPTVMRIVDSLLEQELLKEVGSDESTGGRPATLLQLENRGFGAVGIELGRVYTRVVCVNLLCEIVHQEEVETELFANATYLVEFVTGFIARAGLALHNVMGIGIAAPGPLDPVKGQLNAAEDVPEQWHGVSLVNHFEEQLNIPTYLANDADVAALGETWFGLGNNHQHLLFVLADTGIGAGVAINRSIYCGASNQAGEFSHTMVDINGEPCSCGRQGCVNTAASSIAMMKAVSQKRQLATGENIASIIRNAELGISPDREVVERGLTFLATGIYNFVRCFDPDIVILGGRTLLGSDFMVRHTLELTRKLCGDMNLQIVTSQFKVDAVAVGAATLVLQRIYDHTQLIG